MVNTQEDIAYTVDQSGVPRETEQTARARERHELAPYKGTIGMVYLPLEHEFDEAKRQRDAVTDPNEKQQLELKANDLLAMKSLLDIDFGIFTDQLAANTQLSTNNMSPENRDRYETMNKMSSLKSRSLDRSEAQLRQIVQQHDQDQNIKGVQKRIAAQKLIGRIQRVTEEQTP